MLKMPEVINDAWINNQMCSAVIYCHQTKTSTSGIELADTERIIEGGADFEFQNV